MQFEFPTDDEIDDIIEPEVIPPQENPLALIVRDSGLEKSKAQFILDKFSSFFTEVAKWEQTAKTIVVTDASQTADMKLAREGRLALRDRRTDIEKERKRLKEQSLREGQAIDGIAKTLTALIKPVEDYLETQEKFVEIKAAEEAEKKRKAVEARMEQERLEEERKAEEARKAKEKADAEERERMRIENDRLKKEAEEREKKAAAERKKADDELKAAAAEAKRIKDEADLREREAKAKADAAIREVEEKAQRDRDAAEKREREAKAKADRERKEREDAERKERERIEAEAAAKLAKERKEREALEARLAALVTCPKCKHKFVPGEAEAQASLF